MVTAGSESGCEFDGWGAQVPGHREPVESNVSVTLTAQIEHMMLQEMNELMARDCRGRRGN